MPREMPISIQEHMPRDNVTNFKGERFFLLCLFLSLSHREIGHKDEERERKREMKRDEEREGDRELRERVVYFCLKSGALLRHLFL